MYQDTERNNIYIVKDLIGVDEKDRFVYSSSILFDGETTSNAENIPIVVDGDSLFELLGICREIKVRWLSGEEIRELRERRPGIGRYVSCLEQGKMVQWYFGG